MNRINRRSRVKGFTLMELIIVIAIIGVLLAILMPSMMNYYRKSRLSAANADAKMVYNAAQTAVQRYISSDRPLDASEQSGFAGTVNIVYFNNGTRMMSTATNTPAAIDTTVVTGVACDDVITAVNRTVSDASSVCWSIRLENYIVKAAVSAPTRNDPNFGFYSTNKKTASMETRARSYDTVYMDYLNYLTNEYNGVTPNDEPA